MDSILAAACGNIGNCVVSSRCYLYDVSIISDPGLRKVSGTGSSGLHYNLEMHMNDVCCHGFESQLGSTSLTFK